MPARWQLGSGRDQGFLIEHFGLFDLALPIEVAARRIGLVARRLAVPAHSAAALERAAHQCVESADGDRYTFDIDVTFPLIGWLMHYRGWLLPQDDVNERPPRSA